MRKNVRKIVGGIIAAGFIQEILMEAFGDEDETGVTHYSKLPEHEKDRNIMLGTPGDNFELGYSPQLLAAPSHVPPFGYRYLGTLQTTAAGTIRAGGSTILSFPIPNNSGLSGKTVGYVQGAVWFSSGPGTGSFTNYQPITIQ